MRLDILSALNTERAARRAVVVVTDVASGEQRLVKATDAKGDPLAELLDKHLRSGKSGMEETPQGTVFLTVHVPSPRLVITGDPLDALNQSNITFNSVIIDDSFDDDSTDTDGMGTADTNQPGSGDNQATSAGC